MHLLIAHASVLSEVGRHALTTLELPNLEALVARLAPGALDAGDEYTLTPPHERALAHALGLNAADGELPWAAYQAARDGIDTAGRAWGLVTPVHWHVGADQVTLVDPAALQLEDAESRTLLDAVRDLFEGDGWQLHYGAPQRWYVANESLAGLPCASIDRVIGRSVDLWLREVPGIDTDDPRQRRVRRLQNEVQMRLHEHAVNARREAHGLPAVNSFWLSGCGTGQPSRPEGDLRVDETLRPSALAQDWAAWLDAWRSLDAGPVAQALGEVAAGRPAVLILCGERHAQRFGSDTRRVWSQLWRRLHHAGPRDVLEAL